MAEEKIAKFRARTFMLVLYPDCEEHVKAVEKISQSYDYAMILHNRDTNSEGEVKKPHWHVVLRFNNMVWNTPIIKHLNIEPNLIQECKKFESALLYLIHFNNPEKYQYSENEVSGNLKRRLIECLEKVNKSESEKVTELFEYIRKYDGFLTVGKFASYCADHGYWSEFRRSASIFMKIIDEHNNKI